jgi:hypothetical protein
MARRDETRLINTMRNLHAQGWTERALIVDTAAQVIGGDEAARLLAERVFDQHYKILPAN